MDDYPKSISQDQPSQPEQPERIIRILEAPTTTTPPPISQPVETPKTPPDSVGQDRNQSGTVGQSPTASEPVGQDRSPSSPSIHHTITSDEAVQMFRVAGVSRTRRSITRWCNADSGGESRLDSYYDRNDGRYYITQESIELVIEEEKAKDERIRHKMGAPSDTNGHSPDGSTIEERGDGEKGGHPSPGEDDGDSALRDRNQRLEMEAQIDKRMIEFYIGQNSKKDERLEKVSRYIGHLEQRVVQIEGPDSDVLKLDSGSPLDMEKVEVADSTGSQAT